MLCGPQLLCVFVFALARRMWTDDCLGFCKLQNSDKNRQQWYKNGLGRVALVPAARDFMYTVTRVVH